MEKFKTKNFIRSNVPVVYLVLMLMSISLFSCSSNSSSDIVYSDLTDTSDWTDETHGKLDTDGIIANTSSVLYCINFNIQFLFVSA